MRKMNKLLGTVISLFLVVIVIQSVNAAFFSDTSRSSCGSERFDAIMYAGDNHIMVGTSSNVFSPNNTLKRSQAVMLLYSLEDYPDDDDEDYGYIINFTDVHENDWFAHAVNWAVKNGITAGTSSTTFSPNAYVTREQFAGFLYRYATNVKGCSFNISSFVSLSSYSDGAQVSSSLLTPFRWAVTYGIIQPDTSNKLYPKSNPNRGDAALFMCRYEKNAIGFFDGKKKYNGQNVSVSNIMSATLINRMNGIIDMVYSPVEASIKKALIQDEMMTSDGKCNGITFATYFDAIGRHDFDKAIDPDKNMANLGDYHIPGNEKLLHGINFYQLGVYIVAQHRVNVTSVAEMQSFSNEVKVRGPIILSYFWHENNHTVGHTVIVTKADQLTPFYYRLVTVDPNAGSEQTKYLSISGGSIGYEGKTITTFSYFPISSLETISYLDIDGQYNTLIFD